ncbi:MAG TPA: hypothetical protein VHI93_07585, partial [Candidatus Thermoplasmatota archaeon]|nr:hypothetical protein [Candidatus Thermoplasmatota archaeon]
SPLIGQTVGSEVTIPLSGRLDGYDEKVTLERLRGPFPRLLTIETRDLADTTTTVDGVLLFNGVLPADVVREEGGNTVLRLDVVEGQRVRLARAGFEAEVAFVSQDQFSLVLAAEPGKTFAVRTDCALGRDVLQSGSYRLDKADADRLHLSRADTVFPQLLGRDLQLRVKVEEVVPSAQVPLDLVESYQDDRRSTSPLADLSINEEDASEVGRLMGELGGQQTQSGPPPSSSCTATSLTGNSCEANCGAGFRARCESGIFEAKCECIPIDSTLSVGGEILAPATSVFAQSTTWTGYGLGAGVLLALGFIAFRQTRRMP